MENTYTQNQVDELIINARIEERKRAKEIAYEFMNDNNLAYESKKRAGNDLAFIKREISEECRYVGNAISGGNALSATLGETMEDRIRKEYNKENNKHGLYLVINHNSMVTRYAQIYKIFYKFESALLYAEIHGFKPFQIMEPKSGELIDYQDEKIHLEIYKF